MAVSRHKYAAKPPRRLTTVNFVPAVGLVMLLTAGAAVVVGNEAPAESAPRQDLIAASLLQEPGSVSRSAERAPLPNEAAAADKVEGQRFAKSSLKVHAAAKESSPVLATLSAGDTVDITGAKRGEWAQIMHKGLPRWVAANSIVKVMPLGTSACASGSGAESGLQPDTIKVHRAVCAMFPSIVRYGGTAGRGEHATGHALDIMVGNGNPIGNEVAAFLQEHRAELGIEYLIWRQRIWRPSTSGAWRGMSSRGSATANHMDHVHVTTSGNAAR